MKTDFSSLIEMTKAIPDEAAAIAHFTAVRWKNGEFCPHCGSTKIYHFAPKVGQVMPVHKCGDCKKRFSIKVGTVMEGTKIEVRSWLMAMWFITSHKKGIASTQLAKDLDVTQKTAWFMLHRLRHAARTRSFNRTLKGSIEVDEAFVGGKEKNKHADKRGLQKKAIVLGLLERGGELRTTVLRSLGEVGGEVSDHVEPGSHLYTDEWKGYRSLDHLYRHETVKHSKGEYGRGPHIHVNSIEGYWSQLKRQIYGIHHWVSAKHLSRYAAESVWRYNRRDVADAQRLGEFIARLDGRITYPQLIS